MIPDTSNWKARAQELWLSVNLRTSDWEARAWKFWLAVTRRISYDFRALIGVALATLPSLIDWLTMGPDAPELPRAVVWTLRVVGLALAAQGRPLVPKV